MKEYTEKEHAARLIVMLRGENMCNTCPAVENARYRSIQSCEVCKRFLNRNSFFPCPCYAFGKAEAVKRTWLALEAKGYLD